MGLPKRALIIGAGITLALGAGGIATYQGARVMGEEKAAKLLGKVQASLPPGMTLTYQSLAVTPTALAVTVTDVRLTDEAHHLDTRLGSLVVSNPGLNGTDVRSLDLTLNEMTVSRGGDAPMRATVVKASLDDLDLPALRNLGRAIKDAGDLQSLPPTAVAGLTLGSQRLDGITLEIPGRNAALTLDGLSLSGVQGGRLGTLSAHLGRMRTPDGEARLTDASLSGLDLGQALTWLRKTQGALLINDRPTLDTLGVESLTVSGIDVTTTEGRMGLERFALSNLASQSGLLTRLDMAVDGLSVPTTILDARHKTFLQSQGLSDLRASLHWRHALDNAQRRLTLGPVMVDAGPLGGVSGSLDLTGIDTSTLLTALERPERLLEAAQLAGVSVGSTGGRLTLPYLDMILSQGEMTRPELQTLIRQQLAGSLRDTLGAPLTESLTTALEGYLTAPGILSLTARAKGDAMTLTQLSMGLALVPDRVISAYDIQITHKTP